MVNSSVKAGFGSDFSIVQNFTECVEEPGWDTDEVWAPAGAHSGLLQPAGPQPLSADPNTWTAKQATKDRSPPLEISRGEEDYCLEMTELWVSWRRRGVAHDQYSWVPAQCLSNLSCDPGQITEPHGGSESPTLCALLQL